MKILYISHLHPPADQPLKNIGGMQNVSMQLVQAIEKKDDIVIEKLILRTSWSFIGIKTFLFLVSLLWKIPQSIREFQPDVILFSSMVTASVVPFMPKKPNVPCVTINHGQDVTLPVVPYQWLIPTIFKHLQGVISVSSATRQACIDRGMDPKKGIALPNGFEAESEKFLPEKEKGRKLIEEKFQINLSQKKLLLTVGRQVKRKGHEWFIKNVFHKIDTDTVLLLIGDGPENEKISQAREQSPRKEAVIVAGKQPDEILNAAYAAADLFVMPNIRVEGDMEGFGIVLLEANLAGVPAVAADLEGIKDVIKQGVNGYLVPYCNAEKFVSQIDEALKNGLDNLSESSKKYVNENFNWDFVVGRYLGFLEKVIGEFS